MEIKPLEARKRNFTKYSPESRGIPSVFFSYSITKFPDKQKFAFLITDVIASKVYGFEGFVSDFIAMTSVDQISLKTKPNQTKIITSWSRHKKSHVISENYCKY